MNPNADPLQTATVQDFLRAWIQVNFAEESYEALARKCRIPSKGHFYDLVHGRRKLTLENLQRVCTGFKIKKGARQILQALWEAERTPAAAQESAARLARIRSKIRLQAMKQEVPELPSHQGWDFVYSSLGAMGVGATLEEVVQRSRYPAAHCQEILRLFVAQGMATYDSASRRYFAQAVQSVFTRTSADASAYVSECLKEASQNIGERYGQSDRGMYQAFVFSIPDASFPRLRERLKDLLIEFADDAEAQSGGELARLTVGFEKKI